MSEDAIRHQLATLVARGSRTKAFTTERPTDWRPRQVRNPHGVIDEFFTDTGAWELITDRLKAGHPLEEVELHKPPGRKGYVMEIDLDADRPIYVKLELGSGQVIGRSFHYSERPKRQKP